MLPTYVLGRRYQYVLTGLKLRSCAEVVVPSNHISNTDCTCLTSALCTCVDYAQLKFTRFLACARNKLWWMTPEWGSDAGQLPPETQFLLLELEEGGPYAVVLPLIDGDFRGTLRPVK